MNYAFVCRTKPKRVSQGFKRAFRGRKGLLAAGRYNGAYYLAGYAVECALKACIAKLTKAGDFPPKTREGYYIHDLERLVSTAGLKKELDEQRKRDAVLDADCARVFGWSEEARYNTNVINKTDAELYLHAVQDVSDATKEILPWLQARW